MGGGGGGGGGGARKVLSCGRSPSSRSEEEGDLYAVLRRVARTSTVSSKDKDLSSPLVSKTSQSPMGPFSQSVAIRGRSVSVSVSVSVSKSVSFAWKTKEKYTSLL